MTASEIILVRHGRSAIARDERGARARMGWLDVDGMRKWMAAYDAAEIALDHPPPPTLVEMAATSGLIVASDLPRARASAELLAREREYRLDARLREAPLETPELPLPRFLGLRLPLGAWALQFGARWAWASLRGAPPPGVDAAVLARAEEAAHWLVGLAEEHGRVLVVTHATFRALLSSSLARRGWRAPEKRPFREWSAWEHRRSGG